MLQGVGLAGVNHSTQNVQVKKNSNYLSQNSNSLFSFTAQAQEKIGLSEGIGLFGKGLVNQVKDAVGTIVKHPLMTLGAVGGTTAALMVLPFIGIPTAVGGAAMALGFAGLATYNGVKHTTQFIKNNANGEYDKARKNLEQMGGDTLDLALSAPFVPKALNEVKKFAKYGKVGINTGLVKNFASAKGLKGKYQVVKDANKEAQRLMNFNEAAEVELAKLDGITDAEKLKIKQYIKDYCVPKDKIPEVVLEQWAQERGIHTKPNIRFQSLDEKIGGYARASDCGITINDYGDNVVKINSNCDTETFKQIGSRVRTPRKLEVTYKDVTTGEIFTETIDKSIYDERIKICRDMAGLSEEGEQISLITHEREHIDQYARYYANGDLTSGITPEAEKLYKQMVAEMKPMSAQEAEQYRRMRRYNPRRKTELSYTAAPNEIQARSKQAELHAQLRFQTLDKVFKATNAMKTAAINVKDFIMNAIRAQSAVS